MFKLIKTEKYDAFFNFFVLIGFAIYLFSMQIRESSIMSIRVLSILTQMSIKCTFAMVILKDIFDFFRSKFSINEIVFFAVFGLYFAFIYIKDKEAVPLLIVLYMAAFKDIKYNRIVKYSFYPLLICFIIIILSQFLPFIPDASKVYVRNGVGRMRYTLGYTQHGYAPNYFLSIVIMYLLMKKNLKYIEIAVISVINIIIYILVDTRSSFYCVFLILLLSFLSQNNILNLAKKIPSVIISISFPIGALFCFVLTYLYLVENQLAIKLNSIFTSRLRLMADGFKRWGITLFGQYTGMYGSKEYIYIDSAYMNVFFNLGLVTLVIVIVFYMIYTYLAHKLVNKPILIVLLVTSIHSILDPQLTLLNYSPFILLFICLLKQYNNEIINIS